MRKTKKTLAIIAIVAMVLTMIPMQMFAATDATRYGGADRIATANLIADAVGASDTVILAAADDENVVDALAVAPLAGKTSPIYLTYKNALNADVKAKLTGKNVIVVGAITSAVVDDVKTVAASTEVLQGADRIATNALINAKLNSPAGTFVVGYNAIPDALSVASYAAANNYAIVLANVDGSVDASKLVGANTYVIGGPTLVKDVAGATRLYGADRYATNSEVVKALSFDYDKVYVANGESLVDALAGAPLAAQDGAAVLLTDNSTVKAASIVNDKLSPSSLVVALGGTGVVSDSVRDQVAFESTEPVTCAVEVKNYDDDTKNQYVAFTVNGKTTTVEALNEMGWDVEFSAGPSKSDTTSATTTVFADVTTGLLEDSIAKDDYFVRLTLTKGSDIVVSDPAKITVKNLNLAATGISDYELTNTGILAGEKMNSTKLYITDTATFDQITVTAGSAKEDILYGSGAFSIKTSDAGVISKNGNQISAQTPGTATITITYGNATKAITFTVVDDQREAKKVEVKKVSDGSVVTSLKVFAGAATPTGVTVTILDQYGDPIAGTINATVSNINVLNTAITGAYASGAALAVNAASATASGTSKIDFKVGTTSAGSLSVTVSSNTAEAKRTLELYKVDTNEKLTAVTADFGAGTSKDEFSADTTLDMSDDKYVVYAVNIANEDGVVIGRDVLTQVSLSESKSGVITTTYTAGNRLVIEGTDTGTATLRFKDTSTSGKEYSVKITVVNNGYSIKSITMKTPAAADYAKKYDYKSVLNYTSTGADPIVTGATLSKAAAQEVRLDPTNGILYLDKDSDGSYVVGSDVQVGYMVISSTGTIEGNAATDQTDVATGFTTQTNDDGTIIFKIYNIDNKIVASKSVNVDL